MTDYKSFIKRLNNDYQLHFLNFTGKNCPRTISILSNGDASTWEDKLGSYQLIHYDETENAVYEHTANGGNFLFKPTDNGEMWMVSNTF